MQLSEFPKTTISNLILKILRKQGQLHGHEILEQVKKLSFGKIILTEVALYPILFKMELDGLLCSETIFSDNHYSQYFKLTAKGNVTSNARISEIENFVSTLCSIMDIKVRSV